MAGGLALEDVLRLAAEYGAPDAETKGSSAAAAAAAAAAATCNDVDAEDASGSVLDLEGVLDLVDRYRDGRGPGDDREACPQARRRPERGRSPGSQAASSAGSRGRARQAAARRPRKPQSGNVAPRN